MALPNRFEGNPDVRTFVPAQVLFLVEHDEPLDAGTLLEGVQGHPLVRADDRLGKVRFDERRVWAFQAPGRPDDPKQQVQATGKFDGRGTWHPPRPNSGRQHIHYSAVFADVDLDDETLLALVESMDRRLMQQGDEPGPNGVYLRTVSPNWLASGAPYHIGTGGPGAQPVPAALPLPAWWTSADVDTPGTPFTFELTHLVDMKTNAGEGVQVAILDTAPEPAVLQEAFTRWQADHPLLRSLLGPGGTLPSACLTLSPGDVDLFKRLNSEDGGFQVDGHRYRMADHGLFVAGIIHSIAPHAELHLVRVLNDFGVGTLETIVAGLQQVYHEGDPDRPLIVNMSLTLSLPLRGHHKPICGIPRLFYDTEFLERMGWPAQWACDLLAERAGLLVAAAGNDAHVDHRPHARQPAAFDSVIGVGALRTDGQPADYSNLADDPSRIGIATFGGDVVASGQADPDRGVLGVYIGEFPDGSANTNGWARWAGTSFAAPAVSGVLARLRSTVYSPRDALRKVYDAQLDVTPHPGIEEVFTVHQGAPAP